MMQLLLDYGVDINSTGDYQSRSPLLIAVKKASVEMVRLLLENDADPNIPFAYSGDKPLDGMETDPKIISLLIKYGGEFEKDKNYWFGV